MKITVLSDTHTLHKQTTSFLNGGDLLIHAGDYSNVGYKHEIHQFGKWFNEIKGYDKKIFINGNHEKYAETNPEFMKSVIEQYPNLIYLQDHYFGIYDIETDKSVKIYGSPWQPEFYNWGYNLPKNGVELKEKWDNIPKNIDILVTHGPPFGILDTIQGEHENLGCELLRDRVKIIKPKIHVFGHIHTGYGYWFDGDTHFINASVLNERYEFTQKPLTFEWNPEDNSINFE